MNRDDIVESENENTMEVDNSDEYSIQVVATDPDEVHPLALVAINVAVNEHQLNEDNYEVQITETGADPALSPSTSSSRSSPAPESAPSMEDTSNDAQSSKKRAYSSEDSDDDGSLCPICLDNWTNTGDHRICSLKCGHLFGFKCVDRWLKSQAKKTCPTCKKTVARRDIRHIYAKRLTAVDTTELDSIKKQLDLAIEEKNKAQHSLVSYAYREHALSVEIANLRAQLNQRSQLPLTTLPAMQAPPVRLYMDKSMEACKFAGSRVFDAKCELDLLMTSLKSPNSLFQGFGLKKIYMSSYRVTTSFIPLHTLQIRDISFHPQNNWVLTASMDKTFKVIDNVSHQITYQFSHQMPLWSCCWDNTKPYILYVGTQSGSLLKYDIRSLTEAIDTLSIVGDMSPVVSIASIPPGAGQVLPHGGVVSCKLNSLWIYESANSGEYKRHSISLDGPFVSMKYQPSTRQLLVSSRPNSRIAHSRHTLCTLENKHEEQVDCSILYSFQGGGMQKLLSKSCFLSHLNSEYVAAHQENCRSVFLWSINTGEKVCTIPAHETVLDLKGVQSQNEDFLVSLTEKKLEFFKFV